jgi:excinuclease ABC subunit C
VTLQEPLPACLRDAAAGERRRALLRPVHGRRRDAAGAGGREAALHGAQLPLRPAGRAPARPCLDYHIGRCLAPCVGLQTRRVPRDDRRDPRGAGRPDPAVRAARRDATCEGGGALDFERAATLRDVLTGLDLERRQRALDVRGGDTDVIGIARDRDQACAVLLRVRDGKLLGREVDFFENLGDAVMPRSSRRPRRASTSGAASTARPTCRARCCCPWISRTARRRAAAHGNARPRRVHTHVPARGDKLRLVELANQNARHLLEERAVLGQTVEARRRRAVRPAGGAGAEGRATADRVLRHLAHCRARKWSAAPSCSATASRTRASTAASASAATGATTTSAPCRRWWALRQRRIAEQKPLPELILIDGGRGQLGAAVRAAEQAGGADIVFASLAKREEEVYLMAASEPLRLPRTSPRCACCSGCATRRTASRTATTAS